MLRETISKSLCALGLLGAIALPSVAHAEEVTVALHEDDTGVTLQIRGVEGDTHDQVITSKTGALLFVPGTEATAQRLHPMGKHRLRFVQVGRAGERVAVRVVQRKAARGNLSKHIESVTVPGGFDVRIDDGIAKPVVATVAAVTPAAIAPAAALTPAFDREAALDKLAGPAPGATTVAAPLPATVKVTAPAPAQQVASAAALPAAQADEAAPVAAPVAVAEPAAAQDEGARWAAATTQDAPINLRSNAPRVGMAWLATAMLAFSGLGFMWWRRRRPSFTTPDALRVVARVSIGPKQQIIWLSAGGRTLLVGATEHRIELLADLDAQSSASAPAHNPADPLGLFPPTLNAPVGTPAPAAAPSVDHGSAGNGQRVAAFKQRLRAALGDELSGRNVEPEPSLPPHLEMLTGEPRWARKDAA